MSKEEDTTVIEAAVAQDSPMIETLMEISADDVSPSRAYDDAEKPLDEHSATAEEIAHYGKILEAVLLISGEAIPLAQLGKLFDPPLNASFVRYLLNDLKETWKDRKVELVSVASGWRFQGGQEVQPYLERLSPEKLPRYSRAVMETLAIIAYQQPVTRGDIESIRGVAVSSGTIKTLEDRQWIEAVGHKETPGRPALYATTKNFLDDLGLRSLAELPPLTELDSSHLLEMPDAPAKAAEAPLSLASPILSQHAEDSSIESGDAGFCGDASHENQKIH
ncbi:MAG: SMC-Scp complex subunit ScpB [Burkholderiales bacterium]|nr:SMC-Scp complex subunit ScpB [Burkholderiales bacterium]